MTNEKYLVDKVSLTGLADTLRTQTGTAEPLAFPEGFNAAADNIKTPVDSLIDGSITSVDNSKVTYVSQEMFTGCQNLTSVSLPEATKIGLGAFKKCSSLANVSLPKVTEIEAHAFKGCDKLLSISLPETLTLGDEIFYYGYLKNIEAPNVTSIGNGTFMGTRITSVNFPEVTTIGKYAFESCNSLVNISFPKVTELGEYAFNKCWKLTNVSLPELTVVHRSTFQLTHLSGVLLPNVTTIYADAFHTCGLDHIYLPKVTFIGSGVFGIDYDYGGSPIRTVILGSDTVCELESINAFPNDRIYTTFIYVPKALEAQYKADPNWSNISSKIRAIEDYPDICNPIINETV